MIATACEPAKSQDRLNLPGIITHAVPLGHLNLDSLELYERRRNPESGSFIVEMNFQKRRVSVVCCEILYNIVMDGEDIQVTDGTNVTVHGQKDDPLDFLRKITALFENKVMGTGSLVQSVFTLVSYDAARQFEKKKLNTRKIEKKVPDFWAVVPKTAVIIDHSSREASLFVNQDAGSEDSDIASFVSKYLGVANEAMKHEESESERKESCSPVFNFSEGEFCAAVERAKEYIKAGDIFQVVLSVECSLKTDRTPVEVFWKMLDVNRGTMNYLIEAGKFAVIGTSPEILVEKINDECTVKPLAGTLSHNGSKDAEREKELLDSEKDCAEHRMLVDLARNDLGRVCRYGTVAPKRLMEVEYYYNVMHIVSEIKGMIDPRKDGFDLFRASFPAGTMTGAPKVRAMEIIDELENTIRGFYSGGVGFFMTNGDVRTYINIRSIAFINGIAYARAGAGIVYDSISGMEYQECLSKLKNALRALQGE